MLTLDADLQSLAETSIFQANAKTQQTYLIKSTPAGVTPKRCYSLRILDLLGRLQHLQ
jgi:hypothetical protein